MKTKIVYALVSDVSDFYLEQALISVYSLRRYNPEAVVELVVDKQTNSTIVGKRALIVQYVTKLIVVDVPVDFNKKERSRYLKTNMRRIVKGDYLFIDTDTIVCQSLDEIDKTPYNIAAVWDMHTIHGLTEANPWIYGNVKKMGWEMLRGETYFNSGVFYTKDNPMVHKFYEQWYEAWLECRRSGVLIDQLSLTKANRLIGHVIQELDGIWNCQARFDNGMYFLPHAKILHFFGSLDRFGYDHPLTRDSVYLEIKETGHLSPLMKDLLDTPKSFLLKEDDVPIILSSFNRIRSISPFVYRIMERVARCICKLKVGLSRLKM